MDSLYQMWRKDGGPTLYGPLKTAVSADVLECGIGFCFGVLFFALCLSLIGVRGRKRLYGFIRVVIGIGILAAIMLANFGQEWEVASLHTKTQYRAGLREDIIAHIGAKIGLRSINITLKGDPIHQELNGGKTNETVNYNERFSWDNDGFLLGRAGFGPYAGRFNQEYRAAQRKGLPYPILWIAEYFTIDGEGIRWGRYYLQAGYFAHGLMWLALPLWVLSMILYYMVTRYGAYFTILTGLTLNAANIIWITVRNPSDLKIPFEDGFLEFHCGWSFWLCFATGIVCLVIGIGVLLLEAFYPEWLTYFDVDIACILEEYYVDPRELQVTVNGEDNAAYEDFETLHMHDIKRGSDNEEEIKESQDEEPEEPPKLLRRFRVNTILGPRNRSSSKASNDETLPRMKLKESWMSRTLNRRSQEGAEQREDESSELHLKKARYGSIMPPKRKKNEEEMEIMKFPESASPKTQHS